MQDGDKFRQKMRNNPTLSKLRFWKRGETGFTIPPPQPPRSPHTSNPLTTPVSVDTRRSSTDTESDCKSSNHMFSDREQRVQPFPPYCTNRSSSYRSVSGCSEDPPTGRRSTSRSFSRSRSSSLASSLGLHLRHKSNNTRGNSFLADEPKETIVLPPLTLPPIPSYVPTKISVETCTKLNLSFKAVQYAELIDAQQLTQSGQVCALLAKDTRETTQFFSEVMQTVLIFRFEFENEPVDISLRKLLYRVILPEETQQIERVLSAFSAVWFYFNPDFFESSEDVLYVVFALVMLHTDIYNKSVKHKISKQDFVSHASVNGLAPEILEYFYENVTALPFKSEEDCDMDDESTKSLSLSFTKTREHSHDTYFHITSSQLDIFRPELPDLPEMPYTIIRNTTATSATAPEVLKVLKPQKPKTDDSNEKICVIEVPVFFRGLLKFREPRRVLSASGWRECGSLLTAGHLYLFKTSQVPSLETSVDSIDPLVSFSTAELAALVLTSDSPAFELSINQQVSAESLEMRDLWVKALNACGARASVRYNDSTRALNELNSRVKSVKQDLENYQKTCKHFKLLAPLSQRCREGLAFAAGKYASRCDDCLVELAKLESYIDYFEHLNESTI